MPRSRTTPTTFKRFECVDTEKNHNKFYELSAEMLLFGPTVTRRWGRIGCRRPRTRHKEPRKRGLDEAQAAMSAFNGRGPWWNAGASHMNQAVPTAVLRQMGLISLVDEHRRLMSTS